MSENQPATSRTGFSALLAPSWIGESTSTIPRCTLCSGLFGRLAEVGGQQDQGNADEQHENRAPSPDLLVMHEMEISKLLLSATSAPGQ